MTSKQAWRLAALGFLLHAPGLWLFARARLSRTGAILNVAALALTCAAMAAAALAEELPRAAIFVAWLAGHFGWSAALAVLVFLGHVRLDEGRGTATRAG